jgi:predicted RNA-binding protein with PUA-like domain
MKAEAKLADLPMLRQSRLSVSPVGEAEWTVLMTMAGL